MAEPRPPRYGEGCINEALRIYPIVPGVPKELPPGATLTVKGKEIKGPQKVRPAPGTSRSSTPKPRKLGCLFRGVEGVSVVFRMVCSAFQGFSSA